MDFIDITDKEVSALIERIEAAIKDGLALSVDDLKLLLAAIQTLTNIQGKLEDRDITLSKLRRLLGMIKSSEKSSKNNADKDRKSTSNKPTSKRKCPNNFKRPKPTVVHHKHKNLKKGDICPECKTGKVYPYGTVAYLRVSAHDPFEAEEHICECLRCNACQKVFKAELPEEVLADGPANQQYGFSAKSAMAMDKFFSGRPYHHQETVSQFVNYPMSASTIYDQCESLANTVRSIFFEIKRQAANSALFLIDDTSNRIINQKPEMRPSRNGKGERLRSGIYTSGLVAYAKNEIEPSKPYEIALFNTSLGHAGEFTDTILSLRSAEEPPPVILSDALSSNKIIQLTYLWALCNAHARRNFFYLKEKLPEVVDPVLELYGKVWQHDRYCKDNDLDPEVRQRYHYEHSLPVMVSIKLWCENYLSSEECEEHSGIGKAAKYFIRHYEGLTLFCTVPGVPVDNNRMEETLKIPIRGRKMAHFFKTQVGADVANILTSVIATAYRNGINPHEYLTILQRYQVMATSDPQAWLPWNYEKTLTALKSVKTA